MKARHAVSSFLGSIADRAIRTEKLDSFAEEPEIMEGHEGWIARGGNDVNQGRGQTDTMLKMDDIRSKSAKVIPENRFDTVILVIHHRIVDDQKVVVKTRDVHAIQGLSTTGELRGVSMSFSAEHMKLVSPLRQRF